MTWKIDWQPDGTGRATHAPSGVSFFVSRSGWTGVADAAGASDADLRRLMSEIVLKLRLNSGGAALPDHRVQN